MSARRWGIGLVTTLFALGTALVTLFLEVFIAIGLCDDNLVDIAPGSARQEFCDSRGADVFFVGYLALPLLLVVVGGVLGIRTQRWSRLWIGFGLALVVLVAGPVVIGALPDGG